MNLKEYVHFKPPTLYDITMTTLLIIIVIMLFFICQFQARNTNKINDIVISQEEIKREQITKQYLFEFYITRNQILYIEEERNRAFDNVRKGADPKTEAEIFVKRLDELFKFRDRGGN